MDIEKHIDGYVKAVRRVSAVESRLKELEAAGDHKLRGQVIRDEWSSACQKRNKAASVLLSELDKLAQGEIGDD